MLFLENSKIMFREAVKSKNCFFDLTASLKIILQFPKNNMHLFLQDLWIYIHVPFYSTVKTPDIAFRKKII